MTLEEMLNKLWWAYDSDLCHNKRGGRAVALRALSKRIGNPPDEQKFNLILEGTKAHVRYAKTQKEPDRFPFISTWLNQFRDQDQVPSMDFQAKEKVQLSECVIDGCRNDVHGLHFDYCSAHIPSQHDELLRQAWIRTGISKRDPDYLQQCRDYCKERMKIIGVIK